MGLLLREYREGRAQLEKDGLQTTRALIPAVDSKMTNEKLLAQALALSPNLSQQDYASFYRQAKETPKTTNIEDYLLVSAEV